MMKRKAFGALLAAGMTVVSTAIVSAQWVDHETLTRMMSTAAESRAAKSTPVGPPTAAPRAGMHGVNSLVGSWKEEVTFPPEIRPDKLTGLVTFHDDGTLAAYDQGNVTLDPPSVFSPGTGAWKQLDRRRFAYTQLELISDLSGNLIGFLKVEGTYELVSVDEYKGESIAKAFGTAGNVLFGPFTVKNAGMRIKVEEP
jgi:hypothetical protein